jgi:hypothetical protein
MYCNLFLMYHLLSHMYLFFIWSFIELEVLWGKCILFIYRFLVFMNKVRYSVYSVYIGEDIEFVWVR